MTRRRWHCARSAFPPPSWACYLPIAITMSRVSKRSPAATAEAEDFQPINLGPALEFMRSIWRLSHALELTSGLMERSLGITAQQRMVIRCLGKQPGISPSQLASLLHLDRSTISTALNRMERDGLLTRRADENDRRSVTLWLSAKGKKLDRPSEATVESAVQRTLEQINQRDLKATGRVMEQLSLELESLLESDE